MIAVAIVSGQLAVNVRLLTDPTVFCYSKLFMPIVGFLVFMGFNTLLLLLVVDAHGTNLHATKDCEDGTVRDWPWTRHWPKAAFVWLPFSGARHRLTASRHLAIDPSRQHTCEHTWRGSATASAANADPAPLLLTTNASRGWCAGLAAWVAAMHAQDGHAVEVAVAGGGACTWGAAASCSVSTAVQVSTALCLLAIIAHFGLYACYLLRAHRQLSDKLYQKFRMANVDLRIQVRVSGMAACAAHGRDASAAHARCVIVVCLHPASCAACSVLRGHATAQHAIGMRAQVLHRAPAPREQGARCACCLLSSLCGQSAISAGLHSATQVLAPKAGQPLHLGRLSPAPIAFSGRLSSQRPRQGPQPAHVGCGGSDPACPV